MRKTGLGKQVWELTGTQDEDMGESGRMAYMTFEKLQGIKVQDCKDKYQGINIHVKEK